MKRTCNCGDCETCIQWEGDDHMSSVAELERVEKLWEAADERGRAFLERRHPRLRGFLRFRDSAMDDLLRELLPGMYGAPRRPKRR